MPSPISLANPPICVLKSAAASVRPSNDGTTTIEPIFTVAIVPAGATSFWYGIAFLASQPLAMSQDDVNLRLPTGSNWNEQSSSEATTVTGLFWAASKMAGLAAFVSALKIGKYVTAAMTQPNMTIRLRPILSERTPNTMKKGVASMSPAATIRLAGWAGTLRVC